MTTQETIGSYFSRETCKPIYAVVRIAGLPLGEIKSWSVSKRKARELVSDQWEPNQWRIVRVATVPQ